MCVLRTLSTFANEGLAVIWVVTDGTLQSGYLPPLETNYLKGKGFNPSLPVFFKYYTSTRK
jgi:hypothetical protein